MRGVTRKLTAIPGQIASELRVRKCGPSRRKIIFNYIFMLHGNTVPVAAE
jgi:hypothetical protein